MLRLSLVKQVDLHKEKVKSLQILRMLKTYISNLIKHRQVGTPKRPGKGLEASIFAFSKEDLKPKGSDQHWGLFNPDMTEWANIVRRKYLRIDSFMESREKQNHSATWKGILGSRDILRVWNCSNDNLFSNMDNNLKVSEWLGGLPHRDRNIVSSLSKALLICWQIWNDRNASIFKNKKPFHYRSFTRAMTMVNDYFKENSGRLEEARAITKENLIKWQCPTGFVVRNWDSKPILMGALNPGSMTINVAEALTLREALIWARRRNLKYVVVEGDSKFVIDAVRGACDVP
ncbi:glucan endo-1,3-beta-glucosidase GVI [Pyrus ussuriensis x Pyrus communis]|uniref:glucan endo-1,3-beta-D-glucosidase n=1 Tax=Pyrus ussuriensis x Pyrus communis TaxID=2448454 RepID=A0A5N5GRL9_9ROSA|nr:glucan endo-1,3-beta-glucosidase GVI [Pyrus ussuriensis x Pyrus communis]